MSWECKAKSVEYFFFFLNTWAYLLREDFVGVVWLNKGLAQTEEKFIAHNT